MYKTWHDWVGKVIHWDKKENRRTYRIVDFAILVENKLILKDNGKRNKNLNFARELKRNMENEVDSDNNCNFKCTEKSAQMKWLEHYEIGGFVRII